MEDRELLELAAKAGGFGNDKGEFCWTESEYPTGSGKNGALWNYYGYMDTAELWNPLTDDGDALRLAVKLGLEVGACIDMPLGDYTFAKLNDGTAVIENHQNDPWSATRRAIVRAAAGIGSNIK